jgi:hypothetical protein
MTEHTDRTATGAAAAIVSNAAAAVHQLIQRSPRGPSQAEIAAVLEASLRESVSDAAIGGHLSDLSDDGPITSIEFEPMLGPNGERVDFGFTNREFADTFCPYIRMAFETVGRDHKGVAEMVRGLASEDGRFADAKLVIQMLEAWESIESKFGAIAGIAGSAWARVMAVSEVMVEEDSEVGRALNRGAGKYLDKLDEERDRAKAAPAQPSG